MNNDEAIQNIKMALAYQSIVTASYRATKGAIEETSKANRIFEEAKQSLSHLSDRVRELEARLGSHEPTTE